MRVICTPSREPVFRPIGPNAGPYRRLVAFGDGVLQTQLDRIHLQLTRNLVDDRFGRRTLAIGEPGARYAATFGLLTTTS